MITLFFLINNKNTDSYNISKKISKLLQDATLVNEGKDKYNKYSYIESVLIYTEIVGSKDTGNYAISVSKYNSSVEADIKAKYLKQIYISFHNKIDGTLLEENDDTKEYFYGENDLIFTKGVYLIRINSYYQNRFNELKEKIINILNQYNTKDIQKINKDKPKKYWQGKLDSKEKKLENSHNKKIKLFKDTINDYLIEMENCMGEKCEEYLNIVTSYKKYSEISEQLNLIQNKYDEIINKKKNLVNNINSNINKIENNLNEVEYENVKKQVEELNDTFYDNYKNEWKNRLNYIDEKIYKKYCNIYNYKDVLRTPDNYKNKKAHWFGVVQQKISSSQYRVGVDCEKYNYIEGYFCKNTIYVYYYGDTNIIEDDILKMWGTMDGTVTYTAIMGNSITIPSFYAKYIFIQ